MHWPRPAAVLTGYVLALACIAVVVVAVAAPVLDDLRRAADQFVLSFDNLWATWTTGSAFQQSLLARLPPPHELYSAMAGARGASMARGLLGATLSLADTISQVSIVVVMSVYWSMDQARFERLWLSLLRPGQRTRALEIWRAMETGLGAYLRSELTQSLLAGLLLGVGYALVRLPYPALVATLSAFVWLIPWLGAVLGLGLVILASLAAGPWVMLLACVYTLMVFAALGLGFAAPFTLLTFSPGLLRRLPRPGAWMETLKKALAFPMYAAAAWLVWVLAQQTGPEGLARMLAAAVFLGLAAWLYGVAQRARAQSRPGLSPLIIAAVAGLATVAAAAGAPYPPAQNAGRSLPMKGETPSQPFTPERLADLRGQGKTVMVNFTAAWCVTCQVNERVAFSDPAVAAALNKTGAVYLVADWTNRDPVIAKALAAQGRIGVPLYLVYPAGGGAPKVLPQLLTAGIITQALEAG